jgi:Fe-S-cluster containining protein
MNFAYPRNTRFKCIRCGICCGDTKKKTRHILILEEEAQSIALATKKPISEFAVKLEGKEPYTYEMKKTSNGGKCLFLNDQNCTAYSKRPLICRFYPFGLETNQTQKTFYFTTECPGIGKGKLIQETDYQKLLRRATKSLASDKVESP